MIVIPSPSKQLGEIRHNNPITIEFEVQNISNEPIDILSMGAQCGCTTPSMLQQPIPANSSTSFSCVYSANGNGNIAKSAWFSTKYGTHEVYFSANVK